MIESKYIHANSDPYFRQNNSIFHKLVIHFCFISAYSSLHIFKRL